MPTIRFVEIHPIIVHFPIALLIVGVLLDFLALFLRRAHLIEAASWCLGFGTLGLLAAELSGQLIEDHVNKAQTAGLLGLHKTMALMTVITFVTLFVVLGVRGFRTAFRSKDPFGRLVAFGITSTILLQAFFNISVVLSLVPTKGIPLPLISSGGTSLFCTLASIGILLNISRKVD